MFSHLYPLSMSTYNPGILLIWATKSLGYWIYLFEIIVWAIVSAIVLKQFKHEHVCVMSEVIKL